MVKENPMPISSAMLSNCIMMMTTKSLKTSMSKLTLCTMYIPMSFIMMWSFKTKKEDTFKGSHSKTNSLILKLSLVLFILSEVMLFSSLFWMYLNNSLSPNNEMGNIWPPMNINQPNPMMLALYGSTLLIYSGILSTTAHHNLNKNMNKESKKNMSKSILMGSLFLDMQISEYSSNNMMSSSMNDSNYFNSFFMITGMHGSHVLVGLIMLASTLKFMNTPSINKKNNSSFEISTWYWHFVDIIWLFVFFFLYWANF